MNPENVDFVIYHGGCTDGFGAAWSAWKLLGDKASYFPAYHNDDPPSVAGKNVAVLDFAYSRHVMEKLAKEANSLIVLDHHESNQSSLHDLPYAIFDMKRSGAMMAWNFFHPSKEPPLLIEYIQDRDLWNFSLTGSKEFSTVLYETPFSFSEYDKFQSRNEIDRAILKGSYVLSYVEKQVKNLAKGAVDRKLFDTYDCKVINSCVYRSELGNELAKQSNGIGIVWSFDHAKNAFRVSFRSNDDQHNVAKICQLLQSLGMSGDKATSGGHSRAAGIVIPADEWTIEDMFYFPASSLVAQVD